MTILVGWLDEVFIEVVDKLRGDPMTNDRHRANTHGDVARTGERARNARACSDEFQSRQYKPCDRSVASSKAACS
jgi:hypothetical protein